MAWSTKDLTPIWSKKDIDPRTISNILKRFTTSQDQLQDIQLIGTNSNYLLITQKQGDAVNYKIVGINNDEIVFDYTNKLAKTWKSDSDNFYCIGLLFHIK